MELRYSSEISWGFVGSESDYPYMFSRKWNLSHGRLKELPCGLSDTCNRIGTRPAGMEVPEMGSAYETAVRATGDPTVMTINNEGDIDNPIFEVAEWLFA